MEMAAQVTSLRDTLIQSIDSQSATGRLGTSSIINQLQGLASAVRAVPIQHLILRHLVFAEIDWRQTQIHNADADTCRWILDGEANQTDTASNTATTNPKDSTQEGLVNQFRRETRQSFSDWVQSGNGVLHVSGNPGSGKSTLMKFIASHPTTRQKLTEWSGSQNLVFCQFYFWSAGNPFERTMPGLYRSLLFQSLSQHPNLIPNVFPKQFKVMARNQGDRTVEKALYFRDSDIADAFTLLLKQGREKNYKICFLIDGLDEVDGDPLYHRKLASEMQGWASVHDIKLLVSSRPWQEFLGIFTKTIHLHKLNAADIRTYCSKQLDNYFSTCSEIWRQSAQETTLTLQSLVNDITSGAQGVFLWAHLVLHSVLLSIQNRSTISYIQNKIQQYPFKLDKLYDKLREHLEEDPQNKRKADQMLLLAVHCPYDLYAIAFDWLDEEGGLTLADHHFPSAEHIQSYGEQEITFRLARVCGQMDGLTRGLLELDVSDGTTGNEEILKNSFQQTKVKFCHRTARDYILKRDLEFRVSWPNFDETDLWGRLWLAYLLYGKVDGRPGYRGLYLASRFCRTFDFNTIRRFEEPIIAVLEPFWADSELGVERCYEDQKVDTDNSPSFIRYAAFCGLDRYVLAELNAQKRAKDNESAEPGLLCTCLLAAHYEFVFALVEDQSLLDLDRPVLTRLPLVEGPIAFPEWLVAFHVVIHRIYRRDNFLFGFYRPEQSKGMVQVVERLLDYSAQAGESVIFILRDAVSGQFQLSGMDPAAIEQAQVSGMDLAVNEQQLQLSGMKLVSYFKSRLCEYYHEVTEHGFDYGDATIHGEALEMLKKLSGCACESTSDRPCWRLHSVFWKEQFIEWETPEISDETHERFSRAFRVF
jgi:hypothetical protein